MIDNRKKYAPNKRGMKFYLSEEARQLLEAESLRTTYPMSVVLDLMIKEQLKPHLPLVETLTPEAAEKVMDEAFATHVVRRKRPPVVDEPPAAAPGFKVDI